MDDFGSILERDYGFNRRSTRKNTSSSRNSSGRKDPDFNIRKKNNNHDFLPYRVQSSSHSVYDEIFSCNVLSTIPLFEDVFSSSRIKVSEFRDNDILKGMPAGFRKSSSSSRMTYDDIFRESPPDDHPSSSLFVFTDVRVATSSERASSSGSPAQFKRESTTTTSSRRSSPRPAEARNGPKAHGGSFLAMSGSFGDHPETLRNPTRPQANPIDHPQANPEAFDNLQHHQRASSGHLDHLQRASSGAFDQEHRHLQEANPENGIPRSWITVNSVSLVTKATENPPPVRLAPATTASSFHEDDEALETAKGSSGPPPSRAPPPPRNLLHDEKRRHSRGPSLEQVVKDRCMVEESITEKVLAWQRHSLAEQQSEMEAEMERRSREKQTEAEVQMETAELETAVNEHEDKDGAVKPEHEEQFQSVQTEAEKVPVQATDETGCAVEDVNAEESTVRVPISDKTSDKEPKAEPKSDQSSSTSSYSESSIGIDTISSIEATETEEPAPVSDSKDEDPAPETPERLETASHKKTEKSSSEDAIEAAWKEESTKLADEELAKEEARKNIERTLVARITAEVRQRAALEAKAKAEEQAKLAKVKAVERRTKPRHEVMAERHRRDSSSGESSSRSLASRVSLREQLAKERQTRLKDGGKESEAEIEAQRARERTLVERITAEVRERAAASVHAEKAAALKVEGGDDKEKLEKERAEKLEKARLAEMEKARLAEMEKAEMEKARLAEKERLERERMEKARVAEKERMEKARLAERERLERMEKARLAEKERAGKARLAERERLEREILEKELEREREIEREKDRIGRTLLAEQNARAEVERERERKLAEAKAQAEAEAIAKEHAERIRMERAAVERATSEARARAERAAYERANGGFSDTGKSRATSVPRHSVSMPTSGNQQENAGIRRTTSSTNLDSDKYSSSSSPREYPVKGETPERRKARLERHQRTMDRAAKALAQKNQRDMEVLSEQAERQRLADRLDVDIKRWSLGKEGNIRALLSTLQYVLAPDSGWKQVSLTDLISLAAVKKAYRRAALCVHPDKLQQKHASVPEKYIAEKVFHILQVAWNKFNSEESI